MIKYYEILLLKYFNILLNVIKNIKYNIKIFYIITEKFNML